MSNISSTTNPPSYVFNHSLRICLDCCRYSPLVLWRHKFLLHDLGKKLMRLVKTKRADWQKK